LFFKISVQLKQAEVLQQNSLKYLSAMSTYTSLSMQTGKGVCHYWEHFSPNSQGVDFPPRFFSEGCHVLVSTGKETFSSLNSFQD